jgi:hypothetical protein
MDLSLGVFLVLDGAGYQIYRADYSSGCECHVVFHSTRGIELLFQCGEEFHSEKFDN